MTDDIERALIETETWESIQAQPYDGERYPCGCHPHPKSPHIHFRMCDYHDGFDEGVYQGQRKLLAEIERLRGLIEQVLDCPTNHRGLRSATNSVEPYTAKHIDDSLLNKLKEARCE